MRLCVAVYFMLVAAVCSGASAELDSPGRIYDIPRLEHVVVDGNADDWGPGDGYVIDDIRKMNSSGRTPGVDARIGWNDKGVLVLLRLSDNAWREAETLDKLWTGDSVELYLTPRKADPNMIQWVVAAGMDTNHPELRKKLFDYRTDETLKEKAAGELVVDVDKGADRKSCTMEILFPFDGLGVEPRIGRELAFQLILNNSGQNVWFQGVKLWRNPHHVQRIRLAEKAGPRDIFQVSSARQLKNSLVLELGIAKRGTGYPTNNHVAVVSDGVVITNLLYKGGRCMLQLTPPAFGKPYRRLVFEVGGEALGEYELNTDDLYASELKRIPMSFSHCVFEGNQFPACDFSDPGRARALIGEYAITRRFFDGEKREVTEAVQPGRYGAVVNVTSGGAERRHYVTLYRLAEGGTGEGPASAKPATGEEVEAAGRMGDGGLGEATARLAAITGISEKVMRGNESAVENALGKGDAVSAVELAALHDRSVGIDRDTWSNRPAVRDNRWWLRLRHQIGEDIRLLSPHVFAVNTPPGYDENPGKRYGLFYYCPGRGFDCDETWEGIRVHSAHGLFRAGPHRVAAPFLSCMAHSYTGYRPDEIAQIMEIIEVLYRMDPRRVCIAGHSGGAEHARKFADNYPDRLVAVILMHHGPWSGRNLTGKGRPTLSSSADASREYFDIDRHYADVDDPSMKMHFDTFSKRTYDWLESLTRKLPED